MFVSLALLNYASSKCLASPLTSSALALRRYHLKISLHIETNMNSCRFPLLNQLELVCVKLVCENTNEKKCYPCTKCYENWFVKPAMKTGLINEKEVGQKADKASRQP